MDAFTTAVTSCQLIYAFLNACKDFSDDAQSLGLKFEHDTKALQKVRDYFVSLETTDKSGMSILSPEHQKILDDCMHNLEGLIVKAVSLGEKIKSKKWHGINHMTWVWYKKDFESLAKELFEWTQRLDVHTFNLPQSVKSTIDFDTVHSNAPAGKYATTSLLMVQQRVASIIKLMDERRRLGHDYSKLQIHDYKARIQMDKMSIKSTDSVTITRGQLDKRVTLFEKRETWGERQYEDHYKLATILSEADSAVGLLKCLGFYDADRGPMSDPKKHGPDPIKHGDVVFAYEIPEAPRGSPTVKSLFGVLGMADKIKHSLSQRYKLARRVTIAVMFIHSVGWLHKSIRSSNLLVIGDLESDGGRTVTNAYLHGFTVARSRSTKSPRTRSEMPTTDDFYVHPKRRTDGIQFARVHDMYSLGIVLLEIGLWSQIEQRKPRAFRRVVLEHRRKPYPKPPENVDDPALKAKYNEALRQYRAIEQEIKEIGPQRNIHKFYWLRKQVLLLMDELAANMGDKYCEVVRWCLELRETEKEQNVETHEFVKEVLEKLEDLAAVV